jgi:acyl-CoA dehydrogenase
MSQNESMIAEAVGRILADAKTGSPQADAATWRTLSDAGVPRLLRPEADGGAGNAWRDAAEVLQTVGHHGAIAPLADALVGHALLSQARIEPGDDAPIRVIVTSPDGNPDPVTEAHIGLPADAATHVLELAPWGRVVQARWQPASGGAVTQLELGDAARVRGMLAVAGAAVITGAMRRAFDLTLQWCGTRVQFGRPIGQFQAVQHALALAAEEIAASRAALDWAAAELEAGRAMPSAAMAKARAAEAAGKVAAITHQAHGAIGFTAEYELFRYTRLMWLWRDRWGDERCWQALLGQAALAAGPQALFDLVIGEPPEAALAKL